MEVAMPVGSGTGGTVTAMDSYEDMFKEITRKLYGEDGLPDLASGEKLTGITTTAERGLTGIDYDVEPPVFKPEEHITAFGLAALMQNGFPPAGILNPNFQQPKSTNTTVLEDKWISNDDYLQWTQSKIASYNPSQKLFRCADCDCVGFLVRVAEHWLGTHANLRVFQCPQCPYASAWARCVRMHLARQHNVNSEETVDTFLKENPVFHEITRYLQRLKGKFECTKSTPTQQQQQPPQQQQQLHSTVAEFQKVAEFQNGVVVPPRTSSSSETSAPVAEATGGSSTNSKRYSCSYCPYATDRRDLFTRHENIHREEKPFQCYVCQKQFNRADHVKKHFLRMHREHPYDLNRIRRHPPKNASGMSYYHKYNNGSSANTSGNNTEPINNMQPTGMQHPLTIPNGFGGMARVDHNLPKEQPAGTATTQNTKTSKGGNSNGKASSKKKGEKRYSCCYCSWSGVDNWCLKRHLNTHLKPFVCGLCDYKAARSERLATHVLKVHNKRACGRCLFLADDQAQLTAHQQEHHPLEQRNNRSSNNVLRNNSFNSTSNQTNQTFGAGQSLGSNLKPYELSAAAVILQHGGRLLPMAAAGSIISTSESKPWKPYTPKQHGAARLFNYMEASDGSEPECDTTASNDEMSRMTTTTTTTTNQSTNQRNNQSDFPEAGDVGHHLHQGGDVEDEYEEEMELPLFICRECGCEFVDDTSLETHQYTHHRVEKITTSPATLNQQNNNNNNQTTKRKQKTKNSAATKLIHLDTKENTKENVNPKTNTYNCTICKLSFGSQVNIMTHMRSHVTVNNNCPPEENQKKHQVLLICNQRKDVVSFNAYQNGTCSKRSRKQSQPRKVVPPETADIQVKKRTSNKHRKKYLNGKTALAKLKDKYMSKLIAKKGLSCYLCKRRKFVFPFHTKGSLALHCFWRHTNTKPFECEHCSMRFRHRYQVLLHASEVHVNNPTSPSSSSSTTSSIICEENTAKIIVPNKLQIKEPICHNSVTVPAASDIPPPNTEQITTTTTTATTTLLTTNVPDNSSTSSNNINVEKLSLHPFMDHHHHHSMIHSNMPVSSHHIPIVIPTFPPS